MANASIDYRRPVYMGDVLGVELHCTRIGNASFDFSYRITRGDELVAEARSTQVLWDWETGEKRAFSNELRVDHSITCPIITVRPQNDLPIVEEFSRSLGSPPEETPSQDTQSPHERAMSSRLPVRRSPPARRAVRRSRRNGGE